jgi:hypothetical protein
LKPRKTKLACAPLASFEFPHFLPVFVSTTLVLGSADTLASPTELTQAWEMEVTVVLVSACEDAKGLVRKVALLNGELVEARRAREVAEEKFCNLSNMSVDGAQWLVVSEMEHWE